MRILTVDSKMHDNKSMLFFIERGKLWCILYSSKLLCIKYPSPELVYIFVYNNSRISLNLLYITID